MHMNIGKLERLLRAAVGGYLITLAFAGTIGWWGWLGMVPVVTALVGVCPVYSVLGISTHKRKAALGPHRVKHG